MLILAQFLRRISLWHNLSELGGGPQMISRILTIGFYLNKHTQSRLQTETLGGDASSKLPP